MRREQQLTKRKRTLHTLGEAVTAMKSLAAHHFMVARRSLTAGREYRDAIDALISRIGLAQQSPRSGPEGILLITSDLGLCGDYNSRLSQSALNFYEQNPTSIFYVVGRRGRMSLEKKSIPLVRTYSAPASVDGLPMRLLDIAEDFVSDYSQQKISKLTAISARFEGAGKFTAVTTQILPIVRGETELEPIRVRYQTREHLLEVAIREYLYITLDELLLDALAAEHGMRLIAAESARKWIEDTSQQVHRQLAAVRRENSTQEVLDIVSASRKVKRS
jgi:F-type H+-transporting ATPase subunit gamma